MAEPVRKRSVNRHAVVKLALWGSKQDRIEALFVQLDRTVRRLKMDPADAEPFDLPPAGEGSEPSLHDVIWWLDSLRRRGFREEKGFLARLHATARKRCRPDVLERLSGKTALID